MGILGNCGKKNNGEDEATSRLGLIGLTSYGATDYIIDHEENAQRSKCSACLHSRWGMWSLRAANGVYSVSVSFLFAAFAYRRGKGNTLFSLGFGGSSLSTNVPMAWIFTNALIAAVKRFKQSVVALKAGVFKGPLARKKHFKKIEFAFMAAFILGSGLAIGTTFAGFQIAAESVEEFEFLSPLAALLLKVFFIFNVFSTRFVGSVYLLYDAYQFLHHQINRYRSKYCDYYKFLDDLERYGDQYRIRVLEKKNDDPYVLLNAYTQQFYEAMSKNPDNLRPGKTWKHTLKQVAIMIVTVLIVSIFIINMMPLFIYLTVGGLGKLELMAEKKKWEGLKNLVEVLRQSPTFVWYAALSNEFLYLQWAFKLPSLLWQTGVVICPKIKLKLNNSSHNRKASIIGLCGFLFTVWLGVAYFSGGGYAEDGLDAVQKGFGKIANKTWFTWMGWWTHMMPRYGDFIAAISAGSIVNGAVALSAMTKYIPFFRTPEEAVNIFGAKKAKELLQETIDKGDVNKLAKADIGDTIQRAIGLAKPANPSPSLWQSIRRCCGITKDPESWPLQECGSKA